MRTVSDEETLEIIDLIQEFGKKLYSKEGEKFLVEAKKFLNKEPCWVEEESVRPFFGSDFGHERICIIGSPRIGAQVIELCEHYPVKELNFFEELTDVIKRVKRLGCNLSFPPLELREEMSIAIIRQSLDEALLQEDFKAILREEYEVSRKNNRRNQNAHQRKQEHSFRSKSHSLKTCNARVFRGPWLARGNISPS